MATNTPAVFYRANPQYGTTNVCDRMIEEGHARSYYGGKKKAWV